MTKSAATQRERIRQYLHANTCGTRNEIGKALEILPHIMCPRLEELEKLGHVIRYCRRECTVSHAMNIEYRLSGNQRAAMTRKARSAA